MSQLKLTEYGNLVGYLVEIEAIEQAITVANLLDNAFERVRRLPNANRLFDAVADIRECYVRYGKAGYSFLYQHDEKENTVIILTIKHYRQSSYSEF